MPEHSVTVSVAIVTWNRREQVLRAIQSVYEQPYRPIEVVVADSASTDGTAEAIRDRYPDVKVVRLHENMGCPGGRNIALANCAGDIIFSLDDDAWLPKGTISGCVEKLDENPGIGVISCGILPPGEAASKKREYYANVFDGGAASIRRDVLGKAGYFPSDFFRQAEETDLALRILEAGYFILKMPSLYIYHNKININRNEKKFLFYSCRNNLAIIVRRFPLWLVPAGFLWKALVWNIAALKTFAVQYTITGFFSAALKVPKWLSQRTPVSYKTIRKYYFYSKYR